jgi:hypothetical protein
MHRYDYSFLKDTIPGNIVGLTNTTSCRRICSRRMTLQEGRDMRSGIGVMHMSGCSWCLIRRYRVYVCGNSDICDPI